MKTLVAIAATAAVCLPAGAFGAQRYIISSPNQIKPGTITLVNLAPSLRAKITNKPILLQGVPGPVGPQGPAGPVGPQGPSGQVVSTTGSGLGPIPEGVSVVGTTVQPGTYSAPGAECYWARLSGFSGTLDQIIANGTGPSVVTISPTDMGFQSTSCGTWTKLS